MQDMQDYNGVSVQIQISSNRRVIWINIDGQCALRVHDPKLLNIDHQANPDANELTYPALGTQKG